MILSPIETTCRECGGAIPSSRRSNAVFCSRRCSQRAIGRRWWRNNREQALTRQFELRSQRREIIRAHDRERWRRTQYGDLAEVIFASPENYVTYSKSRYRHAHVKGYRSGLEVAVAKELDDAGVPYEYETLTIPYVGRPRTYKPDIILPNGIVIEIKGRFVSADRTKHRCIREQYPDIDIRFVFSNPNARIGKKSTTTYAEWCERFDFHFSSKSIPQDWIDEPPCPNRIAALKRIRK